MACEKCNGTGIIPGTWQYCECRIKAMRQLEKQYEYQRLITSRINKPWDYPPPAPRPDVSERYFLKQPLKRKTPLNENAKTYDELTQSLFSLKHDVERLMQRLDKTERKDKRYETFE